MITLVMRSEYIGEGGGKLEVKTIDDATPLGEESTIEILQQFAVEMGRFFVSGGNMFTVYIINGRNVIGPLEFTN